MMKTDVQNFVDFINKRSPLESHREGIMRVGGYGNYLTHLREGIKGGGNSSSLYCQLDLGNITCDLFAQGILSLETANEVVLAQLLHCLADRKIVQDFRRILKKSFGQVLLPHDFYAKDYRLQFDVTSSSLGITTQYPYVPAEEVIDTGVKVYFLPFAFG